jgi:hypothetical protein
MLARTIHTNKNSICYLRKEEKKLGQRSEKNAKTNNEISKET